MSRYLFLLIFLALDSNAFECAVGPNFVGSDVTYTVTTLVPRDPNTGSLLACEIGEFTVLEYGAFLYLSDVMRTLESNGYTNLAAIEELVYSGGSSSPTPPGDTLPTVEKIAEAVGAGFFLLMPFFLAIAGGKALLAMITKSV
jgi:hypothetical protein